MAPTSRAARSQAIFYDSFEQNNGLVPFGRRKSTPNLCWNTAFPYGFCDTNQRIAIKSCSVAKLWFSLFCPQIASRIAGLSREKRRQRTQFYRRNRNFALRFAVQAANKGKTSNIYKTRLNINIVLQNTYQNTCLTNSQTHQKHNCRGPRFNVLLMFCKSKRTLH